MEEVRARYDSLRAPLAAYATLAAKHGDKLPINRSEKEPTAGLLSVYYFARLPTQWDADTLNLRIRKATATEESADKVLYGLSRDLARWTDKDYATGGRVYNIYIPCWIVGNKDRVVYIGINLRARVARLSICTSLQLQRRMPISPPQRMLREMSSYYDQEL